MNTELKNKIISKLDELHAELNFDQPDYFVSQNRAVDCETLEGLLCNTDLRKELEAMDEEDDNEFYNTLIQWGRDNQVNVIFTY